MSRQTIIDHHETAFRFSSKLVAQQLHLYHLDIENVGHQHPSFNTHLGLECDFNSLQELINIC